MFPLFLMLVVVCSSEPTGSRRLYLNHNHFLNISLLFLLALKQTFQTIATDISLESRLLEPIRKLTELKSFRFLGSEFS